MRLSFPSLYASHRLKSIRTPANGAVELLTFVFLVFALCTFPSTGMGQQNARATQIWDLPTAVARRRPTYCFRVSVSIPLPPSTSTSTAPF